MLRFMLDTYIVIYTVKRRPQSVRAMFNQEAGRMAISAITPLTPAVTA